MLILGRRANQSIVFPNCGIKVRILDVNGRVTKIGIEAPRHIQVMRGELATASSSTNTVNAATSNSISYSGLLQTDAPESEPELLQFTQRLAQIMAALHTFQQLRASGEEARADGVLADLLEEIASLDKDWVTSELDLINGSHESTNVAEPSAAYRLQKFTSNEPMVALIVNASDDKNEIPMTTAGTNPVQWLTVNSVPLAKRAIENQEQLDVVVCNCDPTTTGNAELVQALRSDPAFDRTLVLVVDANQSTLEQFQVAARTGIDGWLASPLSPSDLWHHIVESNRIES